MIDQLNIEPADRAGTRKKKGGSPGDARHEVQSMNNVAQMDLKSTPQIRKPAVQNFLKPRQEFVGTLEMSPSEWADVLDNPRQRDTEAHARRADHLRILHPSHCKVMMAELDDGRRYKLDGHTRSFLWQSGEVKAPSILYVDVWKCQTLADAKDLYTTFDSQSAVESSTDKIYGALREGGIEFTSHLLRSKKFSFAMRIAYDCLYGNGPAESISTYDLLSYWRTQLEILDACGPTAHRFNSAVAASALITIKRYPVQAAEFWTLYQNDAGTKNGTHMDAVFALGQRIEKRRAEKTIQGRANTLEIIGITLSAFESFRGRRMYVCGAAGSGIKTTAGNSFREWMIAAKEAARTA